MNVTKCMAQRLETDWRHEHGLYEFRPDVDFGTTDLHATLMDLSLLRPRALATPLQRRRHGAAVAHVVLDGPSELVPPQAFGGEEVLSDTKGDSAKVLLGHLEALTTCYEVS